jgi:Fe-S-cluster-containing dehydrogenase component
VTPVFPKADSELDRREFLSVMAASMAMAALSGCAAAPPEKIVPYVQAPEQILPGNPLFFATAMRTSEYALGLVVASHEGRPIKIEGNADHPGSLGATDLFAQASILGLYDPDRAQTVTQSSEISTWDAFVTALRSRLDGLQRNGQGFRILTESIISPTLADLLNQTLKKFPGSRWYQYEPVNRDNSRRGSQIAFGRYVDAQYNFEDADVIVSLDSDFLMWQPGKLHYARQFAKRRRVAPGESGMTRLYVIESSATITGARADHRIPMRSSEIPNVARAIASGSAGQWPWLNALLEDLNGARGRSIVIAGENQSPDVHAFVHVLNERLNNVGKTVFYIDPVEANASVQADGLKELVGDMSAGRVDTLLILGGNPAYTAPADLGFADQLARVPLSAHQSLYYDETAAYSHWHIPEAHYLESWGDLRAFDGTVSIVQPLINPLYQGKSSHELLSAVLGDPSRSNYDIVYQRWHDQHKGSDFEQFWMKALRDGVVPDTKSQTVSASARFQPTASDSTSSATSSQGIEVVFRPDPTIYDGTWANNAWLQETPKPITKLVWDNAALMNANTARNFNVRNGDVIALDHEGRMVEAPVFIVPSTPDRSITLYLGYGRTRMGAVATGRGANANLIRTSASPWLSANVNVRKTGRTYDLVTTQHDYELHDRPVVRTMTAQQYALHPDMVRSMEKVPAPDETLYPPALAAVDYAWGMAVDLSACIGCNACVVACQSENNVPTVGKAEAGRGRSMHWLRIDTYFEGKQENPEIYFEPMFCQHCETAPCELVCPVEATSHSAEGLNEMTYNRCVGTRYCQNNCPYKVRRFNFFRYADWDTPQMKLLYNPDVTVRSRGVMEKCTYCVQRINRVRIQAKEEDREIRDGEIVTACQAVCPTEALVFGNIKDANSRVSKLKAEPRNYGVLAELNTRPRTTYLAQLTNPNPNMQQ